MDQPIELSQRVETIYLGVLRVVVLIAATICIAAAVYFLVDGARRLATSTAVSQEPVQVSPTEVVAGVATQKDTDGTASSADAAEAKAAKQRFEAFKRGAFATYYEAYAILARKYNKAEDPILTKDQVAEGLGYTLEAYRGGEDNTVRLFVNDATYSAQLAATANALLTDTRVAGQLAQYRSAQKSSQACSTEYQTRKLWDRNSVACSNWYEDPMGCSVLRQVPVEVCRPAYPAGVTGPAEAFGQMDRGFRAIWMARQEKSAANAASKRASLQLTRASGMPTLVLAAYVFGTFLVVMFLFLVVAMERHLRRISQASLAAPAERLKAELQAAE